jgi:hypothetical protein
VPVDTVCHRRGRYADEALTGLTDRRPTGRPARFTPVQIAEAKAMACQLPAELAVPLSRVELPTSTRRDPRCIVSCPLHSAPDSAG